MFRRAINTAWLVAALGLVIVGLVLAIGGFLGWPTFWPGAISMGLGVVVSPMRRREPTIH